MWVAPLLEAVAVQLCITFCWVVGLRAARGVPSQLPLALLQEEAEDQWRAAAEFEGDFQVRPGLHLSSRLYMFCFLFHGLAAHGWRPRPGEAAEGAWSVPFWRSTSRPAQSSLVWNLLRPQASTPA